MASGFKTAATARLSKHAGSRPLISHALRGGKEGNDTRMRGLAEFRSDCGSHHEVWPWFVGRRGSVRDDDAMTASAPPRTTQLTAEPLPSLTHSVSSNVRPPSPWQPGPLLTSHDALPPPACPLHDISIDPPS